MDDYRKMFSVSDKKNIGDEGKKIIKKVEEDMKSNQINYPPECIDCKERKRANYWEQTARVSDVLDGMLLEVYELELKLCKRWRGCALFLFVCNVAMTIFTFLK